MSDETTKTMRDLLERWAATEPDKCENLYSQAIRFQMGEYSYSIYPVSEGLGIPDLALIQYAVQAAIVGRGWGYSTGYDKTLVFGNYEADVEFSPRSGAHEQGDNPAEAILKAYLRALEVTK